MILKIYNKSNHLIHETFEQPNDLHCSCLKNGSTLPESFKFLDEKGYILNKDSISIIYHIARDARNRKIKYESERINMNDLIYDHSPNKIGIKVLENFKYTKNICVSVYVRDKLYLSNHSTKFNLAKLIFFCF